MAGEISIRKEKLLLQELLFLRARARSFKGEGTISRFNKALEKNKIIQN
jgi:hypothetical protein